MSTLETILYVEDDPDIREVVQFALEALGGYRVTVAESGREALTTAGDNPPDLIMLDVMMPDLDGPSTLALMRADPRLADVPVVFITAKVQSAEIEHFKSLGAADVIAKPFDPSTLSAQIQAIWEAARGPVL